MSNMFAASGPQFAAGADTINISSAPAANSGKKSGKQITAEYEVRTPDVR